MSRVLAALLPAVIPSDAREHVLGDLAERGGRLRDLLAVLPGVWLSAILRLYTAPTPSFAGATDETIQLRNRQFQRESNRHWQLQFAVLSLLSYPILGTPAILILVGAALLLLRFRPLRPRPAQLLPQFGIATWRDLHASTLAGYFLSRSFSFVPLLNGYCGFRGWSVHEFFSFHGPKLTVTPSFLLGQFAMLTLMVLVNLPFAIRIYREWRALRPSPRRFFGELAFAALQFVIWLPYLLQLFPPFGRVWRLMPHVPDDVLLFLGPSVIFLGLALFIAIAFRKYLHSLKTGREREAEFWTK